MAFAKEFFGAPVVLEHWAGPLEQLPRFSERVRPGDKILAFLLDFTGHAF